MKRKIIIKNKLPSWLTKKIKSCQRCELSKMRKKIVIGKGDIPADILFIGEAPGEVEEMFGKPFADPAGKLLKQMLLDANCQLTYYITNTIFCRPKELTEEGWINRKPFNKEAANCSKYVLSIYKIINPKFVVFIGKVAEGFYRKEFEESQVIYHPVYLLSGGGTKHPGYSDTIRKLKEVFNYIQRRYYYAKRLDIENK